MVCHFVTYKSTTLLQELKEISRYIGNTPCYAIADDRINLFVKLEYYNYTGSIKDRPAYNIILNAVNSGKITRNTTVVESSSGNFAIALATICSKLGIKFIAVIDPNINKNYERLLNLLCHRVVKVSKPDETGGYLLTRLETVKAICRDNPDIFWTNQYGNPDNYMSYYKGLGQELCDSMERIDYAFIGVSTGGTITGLSMKLKERFPMIRIVAVDVEGSIIFGGQPQKRYISGIGASITSPMLQNALIDEVVYVSQPAIVAGCEALLTEHVVFGGASTGASYMAIQQYFNTRALNYRPNVVFLCTDKGSGYLENVYSPEWKTWLMEKLQQNILSEDYAIHP